MPPSFPKSAAYPDLETIYTECSGPGGLQLAEFIADKMGITAGARLLDIGIEHGFQTCFLAKEYGPFVVGIDPDDDRSDGRPHIEHLSQNARKFGVEDRVLGVKVGVPDTRFSAESFDFVYSTTTFEMVRGFMGVDFYRQCLAEVLRILKPGGVFGLGEPMHLDVPIPDDLAPIYTKGEGAGPEGWAKCFATVAETAAACREVGFEILEANDAPHAWRWWEEYCTYDPYARAHPDGEPQIIRQDANRWLSYGYVIARKPQA